MNFPKQLDELKSLRQWVAYRLIWNEKKGKADKRPIDPHTGENAKANDPTTWGTFEEAMNYALSQGFFDSRSGGVGFEFANGYCGIDLDNVIADNGTLKPFAEDIVKIMASFTEYSPSGKGLHVLFKLSESLSSLGSRRRNDEIGLEIYDNGRFFTVTGEIFGEAKTVENRQEEARKIYERYLHVEKTQNSNITHLRRSNEKFFSEVTDSELWQKIFSSQHGHEIFELFQGDVSGYGDDHSRADLALCSHLAYWTNCDEVRMDRMFRQSGLMRPKWDERHGAQTYGAMTIGLASRSVTPYTPVYSNSQITSANLSGFIDIHNSYSKVVSEKPQTVKFVSEYLAQKFRSDIDRFSGYRYRKTGFSNLEPVQYL